MDTQVGQWTEVVDGAARRQHGAVITALMSAAFADPRVHRWLHADPGFHAALAALDPASPAFVRDEALRNVIQAGCLQMIEAAAGALRFAREHGMQVGG